MTKIGVAIVSVLGVLVVSSATRAQNSRQRNRPEGQVYTDPANAGPDYSTQGEYLPESPATARFGAQVIAQGEGKFEVVVLPGGLPGDGFEGKERIKLTAARQGDAVNLAASDGYSGSISDGTLSLNTPHGTLQLKRIIRQSPRAGARPPQAAIVLFDGSNVNAWQNGKMDDRHLLDAGTKSKQKFQDFTLHVEFLLPFKPMARDQERGNSGIYMQDRYEVQILDTFGHGPEFNGCGSLYRQKSPLVDMCYPPLQWQTYDIEFHAAKFDASGKKTQNAIVTVNHNGVIVQDHYSIIAKTGAGAREGPTPGPIQLQGHNNPVFFRNVWVIAGS